MLNEIKAELIKNPDAIVELLEYFDFAHIKPSSREIRFARDECGGLNISIRLENNPYLNVSDYAKGIYLDIFGYISQEKNVKFRDVLQATKKILNLNDDWEPKKKCQLFNGIYSNIGKPNAYSQKTYGEDILNRYNRCGNLLWLNDNISLEAQKFYDVHFDIMENSIIFPWRDCYGSIIAIKSRYNGNPPEGMSKYYYPVGGNISNSLFNYSHCYHHLYNNDVFLFEGEKSCMIGWSRNVKNTLAIGSHSLSSTQCKLILQLQPKTIYFMLDSDLDLLETKKNAELIMQHAPMRDISIKFWDWRDSLEVGSKSSPMDGTVENWNYILNNEIKDIKELMR